VAEDGKYRIHTPDLIVSPSRKSRGGVFELENIIAFPVL
jgi:hypothetical protein